jgi:hypothetical protein
MTHWQCLCPQFHDSRTAAHNFIWNSLAALLQKYSRLDIQLEQDMASTSLQVDPQYKNWRPDGIAWDNQKNLVYLLEFTRCSDNRNLPTPQALERKEMKYGPLLDSLCSLNPLLEIRLVTFAIGYIGSLNHSIFQSNLTSLGVSPGHHDTIRQATITATLSAFAKMATERTIAHNTRAPKQPIRPWEGSHPPLKPHHKTRRL